MVTPYKKNRKGRLQAAFIEAAQIMRNILVLEPANKHRIKHDIYQEKAAGRRYVKIENYRVGLISGKLCTVSAHFIAFLGFGIGAAVSGGALLPTIGVLACLFGAFFSGPVKAVLLNEGGYKHMVKRFERQAHKKIKKLADQKNKRARQLLLSGDI